MNLDLITDCYQPMGYLTPLVRTDFTDDDAWDAIVEAVPGTLSSTSATT